MFHSFKKRLCLMTSVLLFWQSSPRKTSILGPHILCGFLLLPLPLAWCLHLPQSALFRRKREGGSTACQPLLLSTLGGCSAGARERPPSLPPLLRPSAAAGAAPPWGRGRPGGPPPPTHGGPAGPRRGCRALCRFVGLEPVESVGHPTITMERHKNNARRNALWTP